MADTYNPFSQPPASSAPTTPTQQMAATVAQLAAASQTAARILLNAYNQSRAMVYENRYGLASADVYAAMDTANAAEPTIPPAAVLQKFAVLAKAIINAANPGTIVDDVPIATITLPE